MPLRIFDGFAPRTHSLDRRNRSRRLSVRLCLGAIVVLSVGAVRVAVAAESPGSASATPTAKVQPLDKSPAEPAAASTEAKTAETTAPTTETTQKVAEPSGEPTQAPAKPQKVELPWALRPYVVQIAIAAEQTPSLSERFLQKLQNQIRKDADRSYGQMWQLTVNRADWLIPASRSTLARISDESAKSRLLRIPERPVEADVRLKIDEQVVSVPVPLKRRTPADKVFLLTIEAEGSTYQLSGREWDEATETLGPLQTQKVFSQALLPLEAFRLIQKLFRPVLQIESADAQFVQLTMRAGEYLPAESSEALLPNGMLFKPAFRYLDREHRVRSIQQLPWTFLRLTNTDRAKVQCDLISALRMPLGSGRRRRVEAVAIAVQSTRQATRVRLVNQRSRSKALIGYQVLVFNKRPQPTAENQEETEKPLRMLSDRDGMVVVPVESEYPLRWVYVQSGASLLARVPIVPGAEREQTVGVPDDSLQLQVQGQLTKLQTELIDVVARRAVLMALLQKFSEDSKWPQVDKVLAELATLPERRYFDSELEAIRFPAVKAAQQRRFRLVESKIEKSCSETKELIAHHLDDAKLRDLKSEVEELRKLDVNNN